jgi:hypothetical protein
LVVTVLPRPNQAFWTLAALWTAWLWGRERAAPIKGALHRRRYDWGWHAGALRLTLGRLGDWLRQDSVILTFIPEAEPGFVAAALAGLDGVGFRLKGRAIRVEERHALLQWVVEQEVAARPTAQELAPRMAASIQQALEDRGQPAPYLVLHAAAWSDLAAGHSLGALWETLGGHPLTLVTQELEQILSDRGRFRNFSPSREPEYGFYWLARAETSRGRLSDRLELFVLHRLREVGWVDRGAFLESLYVRFAGLLSPDRDLVAACIHSYADLDPQEGRWLLREEDQREAREEDVREIQALLAGLGTRLGHKLGQEDPLSWLDPAGRAVYRFHVQETAVLRGALEAEEERRVYVVPGGRAALLLEKARRDPRLAEWMGRGVRVVKFRHIRRLAADTTLSRANWADRLGLDPPEHQDSQLPLL